MVHDAPLSSTGAPERPVASSEFGGHDGLRIVRPDRPLAVLARSWAALASRVCRLVFRPDGGPDVRRSHRTRQEDSAGSRCGIYTAALEAGRSSPG